MDIRALESRILDKIKPSPQEEQEVRKFVRDLVSVSKTVSGLEVVLVGSIGKDTWLRGNHDIDLFLMFPKSVSREDLEKLGLAYGRRISRALRGKAQIKYAEHPYVRVFAREYDIDVVPCYRIEKGENILSAVDRSPLHLEYVLENIGRKKDEARLLKQFCKGIGVYGSDTKTEGFSGYVCELLVITYGSFEDVIRSGASWKAPHQVTKGGSVFRDQPLIVIDPVDNNRNAAAVVSPENFMRFVTGCREFIKKPGARFFFPASRGLAASQIKKIRGRKTKFIAVRMKRPDIVDDTLYPQMRRALRRLVSLLENEEFRILRHFVYVDGYVLLVLEMEVWELPGAKKMTGPPVYAEGHVEEFLKKYNNNHIYVEGDRIAADVFRENTEAAKFLKKFFSRTPKKLREDGIPGHLAKVARGAMVLEDSGLLKLVRKNHELSELVRKKYFGGF